MKIQPTTEITTATGSLTKPVFWILLAIGMLTPYLASADLYRLTYDVVQPMTRGDNFLVIHFERQVDGEVRQSTHHNFPGGPKGVQSVSFHPEGGKNMGEVSHFVVNFRFDGTGTNGDSVEFRSLQLERLKDNKAEGYPVLDKWEYAGSYFRDDADCPREDVENFAEKKREWIVKISKAYPLTKTFPKKSATLTAIKTSKPITGWKVIPAGGYFDNSRSASEYKVSASSISVGETQEVGYSDEEASSWDVNAKVGVEGGAFGVSVSAEVAAGYGEAYNKAVNEVQSKNYSSSVSTEIAVAPHTSALVLCNVGIPYHVWDVKCGSHSGSMKQQAGNPQVRGAVERIEVPYYNRSGKMEPHSLAKIERAIEQIEAHDPSQAAAARTKLREEWIPKGYVSKDGTGSATPDTPGAAASGDAERIRKLLVGSYLCKARPKNGYEGGKLSLLGDGTWRWTTNGGGFWDLNEDLGNKALIMDPNHHYAKTGGEESRSYKLDYVGGELRGFHFQHSYFEKVGP